jgi:hypothetical protein
MAYNKNKKKLEQAIIKLEQIKQDESIKRIIEQPRDKR